jgi:hypothetical protein
MGLNKPKLEFDIHQAETESTKQHRSWLSDEGIAFVDGARYQHAQTAKLVDELWEIICMQHKGLRSYLGKEGQRAVATNYGQQVRITYGHYAEETIAAVEAKIKELENE